MGEAMPRMRAWGGWPAARWGWWAPPPWCRPGAARQQYPSSPTTRRGRRTSATPRRPESRRHRRPADHGIWMTPAFVIRPSAQIDFGLSGEVNSTNSGSTPLRDHQDQRLLQRDCDYARCRCRPAAPSSHRRQLRLLRLRGGEVPPDRRSSAEQQALRNVACQRHRRRHSALQAAASRSGTSPSLPAGGRGQDWQRRRRRLPIAAALQRRRVKAGPHRPPSASRCRTSASATACTYTRQPRPTHRQPAHLDPLRHAPPVAGRLSAANLPSEGRPGDRAGAAESTACSSPTAQRRAHRAERSVHHRQVGRPHVLDGGSRVADLPRFRHGGGRRPSPTPAVRSLAPLFYDGFEVTCVHHQGGAARPLIVHAARHGLCRDQLLKLPLSKPSARMARRRRWSAPPRVRSRAATARRREIRLRSPSPRAASWRVGTRRTAPSGWRRS